MVRAEAPRLPSGTRCPLSDELHGSGSSESDSLVCPRSSDVDSVEALWVPCGPPPPVNVRCV